MVQVYVVLAGTISALLVDTKVYTLPLQTDAVASAIIGDGFTVALIKNGAMVQFPVTEETGVTTYLTVIGAFVLLVSV